MQQGVAFAPHLPGLLHVVDHATCSRPWIAAQGPGKHTLTDCNLGIKMRPIKPIRIVHSGGVLGVGSTIPRAPSNHVRFIAAPSDSSTHADGMRRIKVGISEVEAVLFIDILSR